MLDLADGWKRRLFISRRRDRDVRRAVATSRFGRPSGWAAEAPTAGQVGGGSAGADTSDRMLKLRRRSGCRRSGSPKQPVTGVTRYAAARDPRFTLPRNMPESPRLILSLRFLRSVRQLEGFSNHRRSLIAQRPLLTTEWFGNAGDLVEIPAWLRLHLARRQKDYRCSGTFPVHLAGVEEISHFPEWRAFSSLGTLCSRRAAPHTMLPPGLGETSVQSNTAEQGRQAYFEWTFALARRHDGLA